MGNMETTTKFRRLKSISSNEDNYYFTLVIYFFFNYKGKLSSYIVKKKSIEIGFKEF